MSIWTSFSFEKFKRVFYYLARMEIMRQSLTCNQKFENSYILNYWTEENHALKRYLINYLKTYYRK